jgi:hypothetical protein
MLAEICAQKRDNFTSLPSVTPVGPPKIFCGRKLRDCRSRLLAADCNPRLQLTRVWERAQWLYGHPDPSHAWSRARPRRR